VPKPEKIAAVEEIREKLDSAKIAILTEFQGLNVAEMTELRKLFREADVDYKVYKNTLTRLAAHQLGMTGVDEYLVGTTGLAFSKSDLIASTKIVKDFSNKHRNFRVKAGILDNRVINSDDVIALADTPPREVLLAMLMSAMQGTVVQLIWVIQAPIRNFIFLLKNLSEQDRDESDSEKGGTEMAVTKEEIIETIGNMSVLDVLSMVKEMEEKFGVSAAMPMGAFAPAQSEAAQVEEEEEQTEFNVMLVSSGEKKIQVIKEVRAITSLPLKDAKALVDSAPVAVKEGVGKAEAEDLKGKLEAAGAIVELK